MKKILLIGIVFFFVIALVSALHGVTICGVDYNCRIDIYDGVCPIDFGANCNAPPDCDIDCVPYPDETICNCTLQGKTYVDGYGCCGDDTGPPWKEDNPYMAIEGVPRCTDTNDNDCNSFIDCLDSACPVGSCDSTCESRDCNPVTYQYECNVDCDLASCIVGSPDYCDDCTHCGDGICNCEETALICAEDCICTPFVDIALCPKQDGVCEGAYQICNASGKWSGCNDTTYNTTATITGKYNTEPEHWCDALDNDCDGVIDKRCDDDIDHYCDDFGGENDTDLTIIQGTVFPNSCIPPNTCCYNTITSTPTTIQDTDDCNDAEWFISPGRLDTNCDGVDQDCSGTPDDGYIEADCGDSLCPGNMECEQLPIPHELCDSNASDCGVCCVCNSTGNATYVENSDCDSIYCPDDACNVGGCTEYQWADYPDFLDSECFAIGECLENSSDCIATCDTFDDDADGYSSKCWDCDDDPADDDPIICPGADPFACTEEQANAGCAACQHPPPVEQYCGNTIFENCTEDPPCTCSDVDGDGYNGTPYGPGCDTDCDDNAIDDPANCPDVPPNYTCNATTTKCAYCINPGIDETYENNTGINYCKDAVDNDCDNDTDFNDPGCQAIVEGYTTYWGTDEPLSGVVVSGHPLGFHPFVADPSEPDGFYNMTTLAGKYLFSAYKESYSSFPKQQTALGHMNITSLNFTLFGCLGDCTRSGVCSDCEGAIGPSGDTCTYNNTHAMEICMGAYPGTVAIYNITNTTVCYLDCCEGWPYCMERKKVAVTSNVENVFKRTLIVNYHRLPVKLIILTFYSEE